MYIPENRLKAPLHYFVPSVNRSSLESLRAGWGKYCLNEPVMSEAQGDHHSIFQPPQVLDFAKSLDGILEEK
jgi:hypothetical protein